MPELVAPQTRIRLQGQSTWQNGDVEIAAGVGLIGSQSAKLLSLSAANFDALAPSGLFLPGALAAATDAAVLRQVSASGVSFLRMVEANLKTGATAADATNNVAVRVRGGSSGQKDLALSDTSRHFSWSATDAVNLGSTAGNSNNPASNGRRARYKALSTLTVASLTFATREDSTATNGMSFVGYIWSADGSTVLGQTVGFSGPVSTVNFTQTTSRAMVNPVTIPAGTEFMVGIITNGAGNAPQWVASNGAYTGQLTTPAAARVENYNGAVWSDVSGSFAPLSVMLGGTTPGIQMVGDLHLDLVANGTGGTPGADLNLRFIFGVSAV